MNSPAGFSPVSRAVIVTAAIAIATIFLKMAASFITLGDHRQRGNVKLVSNARRKLERFLDVDGELFQPAHQQVDNAGRDIQVPEITHIPTPVAGGGIECDEALIFHTAQHLAGEKWVSICPRIDQPGKLPDLSYYHIQIKN